jgi:DNA-binding transcriptional regulator YiaG
MEKGFETRSYQEAGLPHVQLVGVEVLRCPQCGNELLRLPKIEQLHRLIAAILVTAIRRLVPQEVRFLRKYTGLSSSTFAARLSTRDEEVLEWEAGLRRMPLWAELWLRVIVLKDNPVERYGFLPPERRREPHVAFQPERQRWETGPHLLHA